MTVAETAGTALTEQQLNLLMQYTIEAYKTFEKYAENLANPIATFLSVAMMLDFLNQPKAAEAVNNACQQVVADPKNRTRDLGGSATTTQVGEAVCAKLS